MASAKTSGAPGGQCWQVCFTVECPSTSWGEHVRVVGDLPALGGWDPRNSTVLLETDASSWPSWKSGWISLPAGAQELEYKYVLVGKGLRWEDGGNRRMRAPSTAAQVSARDIFGGGGKTEICESIRGEQGNDFATGVVTVEQIVPAVEQVGKGLAEEPLVHRGGASIKRPTLAKKSNTMCEAMGMRRAFTHKEAECQRSRAMKRSSTIDLSDLGGFAPTMRLLQADGNTDALVREVVHFHEALREVQRKPREREDIRALLGLSSAQSPGVSGTTESLESVTTAGGETIVEEEEEENEAENEDSEEDVKALFPVIEDEVALKVEVGKEVPQAFTDAYVVEGPALGAGGFGTVFRCRALQGGVGALAVKVIEKGRLCPRSRALLLGDKEAGLDGEVAIHSSLPRHDGLVALHHFFDEPDSVRLVMDLCTGGDLLDEIMRVSATGGSAPSLGLSEKAAANVLGQLLGALSFIHGQGIVHRDIKAENVLLARPRAEVALESPQAAVKLCDFGFAARCPDDCPGLRDRCGSPDYAAPEVVQGGPYRFKVDIWSTGVVLFVCLRARMPFAAATDKGVLRNVLQARYSFDDGWSGICDSAKDCVETFLQMDAEVRPDAATAMKHKWLMSTATQAN